MATFIEPFAYGTNLASFRTTHVVNDAYTSTLADSFTDTYSTSSSPSPCTPPVLIRNFIQLRLHSRLRHQAPVTICLDNLLCYILRGLL